MTVKPHGGKVDGTDYFISAYQNIRVI